MKKISMYPIYPVGCGAGFDIPAGAQLLGVSLNVNTYYLHALVDTDATHFERRTIAAYRDEDPIYHGGESPGVYLGSAAQAGTHQRQHFFDQTPRGAA